MRPKSEIKIENHSSMPIKAPPHKMEKVFALGFIRLFNNFVDGLNNRLELPHIYNVTHLNQNRWYHPLYEIVVHSFTKH